MTTPRHRLERVCRDRRLPSALIGAMLVLCLPALWAGYQMDDWLQQSILRGVAPIDARPIMGLFTFMDGDPAHNGHLADIGVVPWWSPPDLQIDFWRPLSALTHVFDHIVAPGNAVFAHAHSLVWMALLAGLVGVLFRRIHGPGAIAGLAMLMYAFDEAHGLPVGWLANRNALIAGALGVAALIAHDRARRDGWRAGHLLAPLIFAAALLAGESAIAVAAWLVAHAVFVDRGPVRGRVLALVPHGIVVVVWRIVYGALGYGVGGSGLYIDPLGTPLVFAMALPQRLILLMSDQLLSVPSIVGAFLAPTALLALTIGCAVALVVLARVALPMLAGRREAGFWGLGMLGSAIPICATFPASRLLIFVGIGGAGLVAMVIERSLWRGPNAGGVWVRSLVGLHVIAAPLMLAPQSVSSRAIAGALIDPCHESVPDDPSVADKTVVFINSNDLCPNTLVYRRAVEGIPRPRAMRLLAHGIHDTEVHGIDAHTIDMRVPDGMQSTAIDTLLRPGHDALPVGAIVELPGLHITVMSSNGQGYVDRFRARFATRLDDPTLIWMASRAGRTVPFTPPRPGEVARLRPALAR